MKKKFDFKILVDYFAFSVSTSDFSDWDEKKMDYMADRIISKFMFDGLQFEERRGLYGYAKAFWYNGIVFCFGGQNHIYVQFSGSGCRTWETFHPGLTWESWIRQLQSTYGSFHLARLDIAYDTFDFLKISTLINATQSEKFVSRFRSYRVIDGNTEKEILFGSGKSDTRLRIYDKTLEREHAGCKDVPQKWIRLEFQFRNEMAKSFLQKWQEAGCLSAVYFGVLREKLVYFSQFDGHNYDRLKVTPWWNKLVKDEEPIKLACSVGAEYNLQSLERYVFGQAGSSIKAFIQCHEGDMTRFIQNVESCELNDRQRTLLTETLDLKREQREKELARARAKLLASAEHVDDNLLRKVI